MKFNTITFKNMSKEVYDKLFAWLYENKCVGEVADEEDGTYSITIYTGIELVDFRYGCATLIADTYDSISFDSEDFFKLEII